MGGTRRVGHRVVDVGIGGGLVAAREPACQVPAADEVGQRARWGVAVLRLSITGMSDRADISTLEHPGQ
jgi:hypothetical protein